ncbi:MAG: tripartite tricarboxylate transporter substrate binding protein BugD, partial [Mesorhizobium sp.]
MSTAAAGAAGFAALHLSPAFAQDAPQIQIFVPAAPGGGWDQTARTMDQVLRSEKLISGSQITNVGGAGGTLGAGRVANAEPDGYTLLLHHIGMATSATLYRKLAYDTLNGFEYVGLVTEVPMTIVGRKDLEPTDLKGLVDYAKAN